MNSEVIYDTVLLSLKENGSYNVTGFNNSSVTISGEYLIITTHKENIRVNHVFALRHILRYETKIKKSE